MVLIWTALTIAILLSILVSYVLYRQKMEIENLKSEFKQKFERLGHDLSVVNSASVGVGQHVINVERKLATSMEKQQQLEMTHVDYLPYKQALSLVEDGADASQLVAQCGLSEAEASLLTLVTNTKV
ncbi:MAG: hypothetical protein ACI92E_001120 [Oceanicoccus sp.]|jgi:hypothetical protein